MKWISLSLLLSLALLIGVSVGAALAHGETVKVSPHSTQAGAWLQIAGDDLGAQKW